MPKNHIRSKAATRTISSHPTDNTKLVYNITNCKYEESFIFDKDALPIIQLYNWSTMIRYGKLHSFTASSGSILLTKYIMDCEDDETVLPIDGDRRNLCRDNLVIVPKFTKSISMFKRYIPSEDTNHPAVKLETFYVNGSEYKYVAVRFTNSIIFKKSFSLAQYSHKVAYQLANDLAIRMHESFLRSTPLQSVVHKINKM